jgi:hypothetical protein
MSEHRKFLLARGCQWTLYAASLGIIVLAFASGLEGPAVGALLAAAVFSVLAMTASSLFLTCGGCGAAFFDIVPSLSDGMMGQWKKQFAIWRPVPRHCQSCGISRT